MNKNLLIEEIQELIYQNPVTEKELLHACRVAVKYISLTREPKIEEILFLDPVEQEVPIMPELIDTVKRGLLKMQSDYLSEQNVKEGESGGA